MMTRWLAEIIEMNYLIDNSILFSPEKRTISSRNNPTISISLTTTAARLLDELARNNGDVLTRAYLLKTVWEDNGYASSDASLNNNISLLRKNFATVGDVNVELKTIPKVGFKLIANIETLDDKSFERAVIETSTSDEHVKFFYFTSLNKMDITLYLLAILIIIAAFILVLRKNDFESFNKIDTIPVQKFGKCDVFNISNFSFRFENVLNVYPEIKGKCQGQNATVYYDFSDMKKDRTKNLFVAICYQSKHAGYHRCENLKSYSHQ